MALRTSGRSANKCLCFELGVNCLRIGEEAGLRLLGAAVV